MKSSELFLAFLCLWKNSSETKAEKGRFNRKDEAILDGSFTFVDIFVVKQSDELRARPYRSDGDHQRRQDRGQPRGVHLQSILVNPQRLGRIGGNNDLQYMMEDKTIWKGGN